MKRYLVVIGESCNPLCDFVESNRIFIKSTTYSKALSIAEKRLQIDRIGREHKKESGVRYYDEYNSQKKAIVLDCKLNYINNKNYKQAEVLWSR